MPEFEKLSNTLDLSSHNELSNDHKIFESSSRPSTRKFSPDDEAAIEAAVEIALLLSSSSKKNAETLVKTVLTDNFHLLSATAATIRAETQHKYFK
jgi:hypothetical protein